MWLSVLQNLSCSIHFGPQSHYYEAPKETSPIHEAQQGAVLRDQISAFYQDQIRNQFIVQLNSWPDGNDLDGKPLPKAMERSDVA